MNTNFESLENELILHLFEYFNTIELVQTFHGLNLRFNQLLHFLLPKYTLDFRSTLPKDFDVICQNYLPLIRNDVISLCLLIHADEFIDGDDVPVKLDSIFMSKFHFERFANIQSLSLSQLDSMKMLNQIILNCSHLVYLKVNKPSGINDTERFDDMETVETCINNIWSLSKLKHCSLNSLYMSRFKQISSSIERFSLTGYSLELEWLSSMFRCTPNLQSLNITIRDYIGKEEIFPPLSSLTNLSIYFRDGSYNNLRNLLASLSNLSTLIIQMNFRIDGYQLQDIIASHLHRLNTFQFFTRSGYYYYDDEYEELSNANELFNEDINYLFRSFQTKFWMEEHRWFIQCDYSTKWRSCVLYSLPCKFKNINFWRDHMNMSKSTDPMHGK